MVAVVGPRDRCSQPIAPPLRRCVDTLPRKLSTSIWRTWISEPRDLEDMIMDARRIWGIMEWCGVPEKPRAVAEALAIHPKDAEELLIGVLFDEHPIAVKMRQEGLPVEHAVPLPEEATLRCMKCGVRLSAVPCLSCTYEDTEEIAAIGEDDLPDCDEPTDHLPGSDEKIRLMAKRAVQGYSVFCKGDAQGRKDARIRRKRGSRKISDCG